MSQVFSQPPVGVPPAQFGPAAVGTTTLQPFECTSCGKRFTRQENLKRHYALHSRSDSNTSSKPSYVCAYCDTTFSRVDLRRRHVKKKHPEEFDAYQDRTGDGRTGSRARSGSSNTPTTAVGPSSSSSSHVATGTSAPTSSTMDILNSSALQARRRTMGQEDIAFEMDLDNYQAPTGTSYQSTASFASGDSLPNLPPQLEALMQGSSNSNASPPVNNGSPLGAGCATPVLQRYGPQTGSDWPRMSRQPSSSSTGGYDSGHAGSFQESASSYTASHQDGASQYHGGSSTPSRPIWKPTPAQISQGVRLFFSHVSHFLPFIHRATFDPSQAPTHLVLAMLCLGFQYGSDPEAGEGSQNGEGEGVDRENDEREESSGSQLSQECFRQAKRLLARSIDGKAVATTYEVSLPAVQAYLLLQLYSVMYRCGSESSEGLMMQPKIVQLCRSGGLMQPMQSHGQSAADLDSLWRDFVRGESHKRTLLAVHQMDALWYQFLSLPRSVSHLEIKHDMPCPQSWWSTSSASEWAHRTLIANRTGATLRYREVIQRLLAEKPQLDNAPNFDPYGAINVIHFILSSVREVTGWSTMTARPNFDRLEALRTSLDELQRFVRPALPVVQDAVQAISVEATWEMAKIELLSWSPSHTGGVIESDFEGALATITSLATSRGFLFSPEAAHQVKPHLAWFLRYLDSPNHPPELEPPWVLMYCFEAYTIAWQLMKYGFAGCMDVVGVQDGDVEGARRWGVTVFARRRKWRLGQLIYQSVQALGEEEDDGEGFF